MKIWLDDVREAPKGWIHVKTPEEAIELLRKGSVDEISLDHDLGLATLESERTGYDVVAWVEEELATGRWHAAVPLIRIHSANPVGWRRMEQAIKSIRRLDDARSNE